MNLAIDFGTSNTVVATYSAAEEQPVAIRLRSLVDPLDRIGLVPSLVYVDENDGLIFGHEVKARGLDNANDERLFRNMKKTIGSQYRPFPVKLDGEEYDAKRAGELFLLKVLEEAIDGDEEDLSLTFTVPVEFFSVYKGWIHDVVQARYPEAKIGIVDESTAAALGNGDTRNESVVCVIDFGGGTLDVSIVRVPELSRANPFDQVLGKVLAKAGEYIGGTDIDTLMADEFLRLTGANVKKHMVEREAERVKIALSTKEEEVFSVQDRLTGKSVEMVFTRDKLVSVLHDELFFAKLGDVIQSCLDQLRRWGLGKADIDKVVMVGGTCLIPSVQKAIRHVFDTEASQKTFCRFPFEAVSFGAISLSSGAAEIVDFLRHSYGIRVMYLPKGIFDDKYRNKKNASEDFKREFRIIFQSGQECPAVCPGPDEPPMVMSCHKDNQDTMSIVVAEIRHGKGNGEVVYNGNSLIYELNETDEKRPLNDGLERFIFPIDPPGFLDDKRIEMRLSVDKHKRLLADIYDTKRQEYIYQGFKVIDLT